MKRFKEFINEAFDRPLPYRWKSKNYPRVASFSLEDQEYKVMIRGGGNEYDIEFGPVRSSGAGIDVEAETGKHQALKVLSTVVAIIMDFVNEKQPEIIGFSGKKAEGDGGVNRAKTYRMMLKRKLPKNYEVLEVYEDEDDVSFEIGKKK